jgi:HEAT repeat protein
VVDGSVTLGQWFRTAAILLAATAVSAPPRAGQAQTTTPDAAAVAKRDLDQLSAVLTSPPDTAQDTRDEAARRLVSRHSAEARTILASALSDPNKPAAQIAAARALQDDAQPDPSLINPLFAALGTNNRQLTEAVARALANYKTNPEVLDQLISIVDRRPAAPEQVRREIISALGSIIEKRAAQTLVEVLKSPDETAATQAAAADALADLTGISDYGQDPSQWTAWWAINANKSEADFRNDLLPPRSAKYDQVRERYNDLTSELKEILKSQYQNAAATQRPDVLLGYLKSAQPEIRGVGVQIIKDDAADNKPIPKAAQDQLRSMIGDSSADVRAAVADALARINDKDSLDPLLAQLAQETDGKVRAALARALAPINDLRAVPALIGLLDDSSIAAARAAAEALEQLGEKIRVDNPSLALQTARALRAGLEKRSATPGNSDLREAMVDAMTPLRDDELLPTFYSLLNERSDESAQMHRLALKGIGEIGNPQSAAVIAPSLNDRDAVVRLEAVKALGKVHTAGEYAETLVHRLDANEEPDPSVRDAAWQVLQGVLPDLAKEKLSNFADRFKDQPEMQVVVLKALADQLAKLNMQDELAATQQNIGADLMRLNDPKSAAEYFRQALEARKKQGQAVPGVVLVGLMEDRMKALLLSKQYPDAIAFAAQNIRENANNQQSMGAEIRQEADRLCEAGSLNDALKLIQEAQKMDPPLAEQYRDQLSEIEADIQKRLNQRGGNPTPPEPIHTASGAGT